MQYHPNNQLLYTMKNTTSILPRSAETFSLGRSIDNNYIIGVRLNENDRKSNQDLKPMVKLIGNIHGNEPVGRELLIHFARYILSAVETPPNQRDDLANRAANILKMTDLWILPSMNPDGFKRAKEGKCGGEGFASGRTNRGFKDLNRDFPTWKDMQALQVRNISTDDIFKSREKETKLMMKWTLENPFVLSASFHDGAVVVGYPYGDYRRSTPTLRGLGISKSPDHDVFYHLATTYSFSHAYMKNATKQCPRWGHFENGVTNGADWYPYTGGMQDFNYIFSNAMELTIEVSCCKYPRKIQLLKEWEANMKSMIAFVEQAHIGIKGIVTRGSPNGPPIENARIFVRKLSNSEKRSRQNDVLQVDIEVKDGVISTNSNGIYWKLLTPGNYLVKAVVFSRDGKEVTKNDWSNASPSMESVVQKVEVKNTNKSSSLRNGRRAVLEEAKILNLYVKPIQ